MRSKRWLPNLGALLVLLVLPLLLFWPVTAGSKTLVPADNLYQWEPYRSFAGQQGVPLPPQNELLSDLVLENLVWKQFIIQSIENRELPLWNPHLFAGAPFLAAGQHSALYPLSAIFYVLPLEKAYGLFTVLSLWLAGVFMYVFGRTLRMGPFPALIAGIVYQLGAFFLVSVVFTMIIAAAAWLPLLLAIIEIVVRKQEEKGAGPFVPIVYVVLGSLALGMHVLAGHPEILVYTLMVMALYALVRLLMLWRRVGAWKPSLRLGLWFAFMAGLGLGLGSVQLIPLFELVTQNFREGSVTYSDVVGWAYPTRQVLTFLLPDFFGNPAHHGYWSLVSRQWVHVDRIFWGIKNYVEAGSYVGIVPLLLALVAVLPARRRTDGSRPSEDRRHIWIFAALAAVSLLLVFGTPLYALLYYGLPGIKQLHSPFRWVFPYTLSVAVLAGFGARRLTALRRDYGVDSDRSSLHPGVYRPWISLLTWAALGAGLALLAGLLVVFLAPGAFVPVADRLLAGMESAQEAFATGEMFLSYQWLNLLIFALVLTAGGIVLRISRCPLYVPIPRALAVRLRTGRIPVWQALAVVAVALDLLLFGWGFNPAANPAWLEFTPPSIEYLQQQAAEGEASTSGNPWRITTYRPAESTKTLNPNIPWYQGLEDIRGYDSIIPAQYANYMRAIEGQGELLYNRIAPIYGADNLDSSLLDLLGVRYVMTEGEIPNAGFELVYDDEVRIYANSDVMPRAFALPRVQVIAGEASTNQLHALDPRQMILLDGSTLPDPQPVVTDTAWSLEPARVVTHAPNVVFVDVEMPGDGWLLLADSYFPGWKAYRSDLYRVAGDGQIVGPEPAVPDPKFEPEDETELDIVRADGNFRAVFLEEGAHRVRFKYTPMSFKLGLYGSFMAVVVLFLLVLYWLWGRFYRESADDHTVKRVAKNSLLPMGLQLMNRLIDFAFAMLMLRILAPEMAGRYTFAVLFIGYFDILVRFGLGTLLTREVSKDREHGNRYLSTVTILRGLLWLTSLPLMTIAILAYAFWGQMTPDIVAAIALFALGLVFSSLADGFSAVFNAYEKMEYPAAISTITTVTRVSLGALVLLLGWGFVGLAGVSIAANIVSAAALGILMARHCFRPHIEWDRQTGKWMLGTSFPLMINLMLATIFFRIDVLLLKPMRGDMVVGYYSAALKYVDGLLIIPQYFTVAIFPLMSRYAATSRDSLMRAYVLSLRLLLIIALPIAAAMPFIAEGLIMVLGGGEYLPDSMIALQIIIWFLPFSFVNSVTQYILIAIDQQRFLTRAFLIGVVFNITANLVVIPTYSYQGAAVVTILSELVLLVPFYYAVRKHLGPLPWLSLFWQPTVASAVMAGAMWLLRGIPWVLLIPVGGAVYLVVLALVGGFRQPDMDLLGQLLPVDRLKARFSGRR